MSLAPSWKIRLGAIACCAVFLCRPVPAQTAISDFSFVQLSDTRVEPRFFGEPEPKHLRGEEALRWIADELKKPQRIGAVEIAAPSFAVVTGNITEFGAPGETWKDVERLVGLIGLEWFAVAGERDNAYSPIAARVAARQPIRDYGASRRAEARQAYSSFDRYGCHFVVLSSATIHESKPSLDVDQLAWLRQDLRNVPNRPVFVFVHHPLDSVEFAQPYELHAFLDAIEGANIALVLHGHRGVPACWPTAGLDCVREGAAFVPSVTDERGYTLVSVVAGWLRVEYRFLDPERPTLPLLEKQLVDTPSHRFLNPPEQFGVYRKTAASVMSGESPADVVTVVIGYVDMQAADDFASRLGVLVDGNPLEVTWRRSFVDLRDRGIQRTRNPIEEVPNTKRSFDPAPVRGSRWTASLDPKRLAPGLHLITVELALPDGMPRECTSWFRVVSPDVDVIEHALHPVGSHRAGPAVAPGGLIAVAPSGGVSLWRHGSGEPRRRKAVLGIAGTPQFELAGESAVLITGSPDGFVRGLRIVDIGDDHFFWSYDARAPVYGSPLVDDGVAYIGDAAGRLHAIDTATHAAKWVFDTHGSSIEVRPTSFGDLVVFGTWDGFVYALNKDDGKLAWKRAGARSSRRDVPLRDSAPADCPAVAICQRVFVCDRGYEIASYSATGEMTKLDVPRVTAIGASEDGQHLFARGLNGELLKITGDGGVAWTSSVGLGRSSIAPLEVNGIVHVCSDRGRVAWVDGKTAAVLATYQATPGAYVMAPLAVDDAGTCWVAGMDGSVTGLLRRPR